jgi:hypothetical protein
VSASCLWMSGKVNEQPKKLKEHFIPEMCVNVAMHRPDCRRLPNYQAASPTIRLPPQLLGCLPTIRLPANPTIRLPAYPTIRLPISTTIGLPARTMAPCIFVFFGF